MAFLASALQACGAGATSGTKDADASVDVVVETPSSDRPTFSSDASVTCASTKTTAVPSDGGEPSCLFALSPPLPAAKDLFLGVSADGVAVPAEQFELHGDDVLELTGQACADYRAGTITNVAVVLFCSDG